MSDDEETFDMFQEPAGYFQEEKKPTFVQHQLSDGTKLDLRLVGHNPLWVSRSHKVFSLSIFEFNHCRILEHSHSSTRHSHDTVQQVNIFLTGAPSMECGQDDRRLHGIASRQFDQG